MSGFEQARVKVKQGWLQGDTAGPVKIFKGIPYAAPPVGERRFRKPEDPGRWRGVRKAVEYSAAAIQQVMENPEDISNVHGVPQLLAPSQYEEDCLYLNVWTPAKTGQDRLPVFVWVHGGGLVAGSGVECVCDGEGLAKRKDMVVVTINYRLGFFGFFAHPELAKEGNGTSGNYALYDIRKACQWIKENIAAFGGDPDRITVAGQSGGAVAVGALHASPLMKGLIQRVSIESGPIFWGFMKPAARQELEEKGQRFLEAIGCTGIEELRKRDAWELFDAYREICQDPMYFTYCIDGEFLPEPYEKMLEGGNFNDFDVMIGSCAQEILPGGEEGIPTDLYEEAVARLFPDAVDRMKEWYPAKDAKEARKQWSTIASDLMLMGSVRLAELCRRSGHKAYVWLMNKENETQKGRRTGSPHCAEMPYVFGRVDKGERNPFLDYHWVGKDYDFMELIQNYWYHFSESGDPNSPGAPEWNPYERDFDVCILGNDSHMMTDREREKYAYYYGRLMSGEVFPVKEMMMRGLDCGDVKKAEA